MLAHRTTTFFAQTIAVRMRRRVSGQGIRRTITALNPLEITAEACTNGALRQQTERNRGCQAQAVECGIDDEPGTAAASKESEQQLQKPGTAAAGKEQKASQIGAAVPERSPA